MRTSHSAGAGLSWEVKSCLKRCCGRGRQQAKSLRSEAGLEQLAFPRLAQSPQTFRLAFCSSLLLSVHFVQVKCVQKRVFQLGVSDLEHIFLD